MSIMGLGRASGSRSGERGKRVEPTPPSPAPRPAVIEADPQARRFQLGAFTLDAVDRLTGMTAEEIEVVADRLMDGARETEEVLRELAHRVREYGVIANEKVANFVDAANRCAEAARTMQVALEEREDQRPDDQSAAESPSEVEAPPPEKPKVKVSRRNDLTALQAEIEAITPERAPPIQPGD